MAPTWAGRGLLYLQWESLLDHRATKILLIMLNFYIYFPRRAKLIWSRARGC